MIGRTVLVVRLLVRDLRRRRAETLLLVVAITAATATLTLGLAVSAVAGDAYAHTREVTAGPDVVADTQGYGPDALAALTTVTTAPGVTGHSGPFPLVFLMLTAGGSTVHVVVEGRDAAPAAVDRPALADGSWVRPGGAVVERAFADALDVQVGDTVRVGGHPLRVTGIAVTAASIPFPNAHWHEPGLIAGESGGLIWVDRRDIAALAGNQQPSYTLNLTTADPAVAATLPRTDAHRIDYLTSDFIAERNAAQVADARAVLVIGGWLLSGLAIVGVAGVVAARVIAQRRRVGLLKAIGAGPALVAAVHLAEYLVIGLTAAGAGVAIGWLAAPSVTGPGAGLVATVGARPPTLPTVVAATTLALAVALAATLVPVIRAATTSTMDALADAAAPPRRRRWRVWISRRLPVSLLLGVRLNARRPRRARLVTMNALVTTVGLIAALVVMAQNPRLDHLGGSVLPDPRSGRVHDALLVVALVLCGLALLNASVSTWAAVLDARQPMAVARTLGATAGQAGLGMAVAQVLPAVPGVVVGVYAGRALYWLNDDGDFVRLSRSWEVGVPIAVLLVLALLAAVPTLVAARRPVADTL